MKRNAGAVDVAASAAHSHPKEVEVACEAALVKARELRDAHFSHITIFNVQTGVEITDVEALLVSQENDGERGR